MKTVSTFYRILLLFLFTLNSVFLHAQLGFCGGNSGSPIFTETFGTGTNAIALPAGTTTYTFNPNFPNDGSYLVSNMSDFFGWHTNVDHTGDTNGRYFSINADDATNGGEFYKTTISGLCENTSYEFSSWLLNILPPTTNCPNGGIPINVKFQIWDNTNTILLASGDTGDIKGSASPDWNRYGLVFKTELGQTRVILKMLNNGIGGCGNDLAIDDIVFKSCGDFITVLDNANENNLVSCEDLGPVSTTLTATPDFSIFSTHTYQWQESTDIINWVNIIGATNQTYTTPLIGTTTYYRAKVSEDPINISNSLCNVLSETFSLYIIRIPVAAVSNGDITNCQGEVSGLSVTVPSGVSANWYDAAIGGNLLEANTTFFQTETAGIYYAEAISELGGCIATTRTAVNAIFNPIPILTDENLTFCENKSINLSADITNATYLWNTGETTYTISVNIPDTYTVLVTDINGCSNEKVIILEQIDAPILESITSDGPSIIVTTANDGNFEYALNFGIYQISPIFNIVAGGQYTVNIRERNFCGEINEPYIHLVIPQFFTPNGDNTNDTFKPEGIPTSTPYSLNIYDRYGKLMLNSLDSTYGWDGTFNGSKLPAADYWYTITIDSSIRNGHFSLKR